MTKMRPDKSPGPIAVPTVRGICAKADRRCVCAAAAVHPANRQEPGFLVWHQGIWCEYYHMDAGLRRRVDIGLTPLADRFLYRIDANQYHESFAIRPEEATEQNPFVFPW